MKKQIFQLHCCFYLLHEKPTKDPNVSGPLEEKKNRNSNMWCMPFSSWGSTPGHICAGIEQNCITSVLLALCICLKQQF